MERRLGRGLDSLLSGSRASKPKPAAEPPASPPPSKAASQEPPVGAEGDRVVEVEPSRITPNPYQPRKHFDEAALQELADSLQTHGVLQALVVREAGDGFELIAGERRLRAAQIAKLDRVPVIVRSEVTDQQMLEWAMVENLQRRDLDPIERAHGYKRMLDELSLTQAQVAERVGLKRSTITNHLRLLDLAPTTQDLLAEGTLTMGHARALLGLDDEKSQGKLAREVLVDGLSVREVERRVRERVAPSAAPVDQAGPRPGILGPKKDPAPAPAWLTEMERRLRESLGTRVELKNQPGYRGQIVLNYDDRATLERIAEMLAPKSKV